MATRAVQLRDTLASPSALTLKLFARGEGATATAAFSGASTVTDDVHAWSLVDLTAGNYDVVILSGSTRVWTGNYTHADAGETVQLVDCGVVEASILGSLSTLLARITSGVATMFGRLILMINGSNQFTADALSLAPTGSGGGSGSGAFEIDDLVIKLQDGVTVVGGCDVIITTTSGSPSLNVHAAVTTLADGSVPAFLVDTGVYYLWRQKSGVSFTNPLTLTVASGGSYTIT